MKNIRRSVFETNSSSTHSITISCDVNMYDTIPVDENYGTVTLKGGAFGRYWARYNDPMTKANYCAVFARGTSYQHLFEQVIKEHTGAKDVIFDFKILEGPDYDGDSYIDHNSEGVACEAFKSAELLKNFIFNPKSWLFIAEDEGFMPPNFYDVDSKIIYTHILRVENIELSEKLTHVLENEKELIDVLYRILGPSFDRYASSEEQLQLLYWPKNDSKGVAHCSWDHLAEGFVSVFKVTRGYSGTVTSERKLKFSQDVLDPVEHCQPSNWEESEQEDPILGLL
jgi:hypothetical protein